MSDRRSKILIIEYDGLMTPASLAVSESPWIFINGLVLELYPSAGNSLVSDSLLSHIFG
jgi:hypothetical protein